MFHTSNNAKKTGSYGGMVYGGKYNYPHKKSRPTPYFSKGTTSIYKIYLMTHRCRKRAADRFSSQGSNDAHETKKKRKKMLVEVARQVNNRNLKAMLCRIKDLLLHPPSTSETWTVENTVCVHVASVCVCVS